MKNTKTIQFQGGVADGKIYETRLDGVKKVTVPVREGRGYGQIDYIYSGNKTIDGMEIWIPEERIKEDV